MGRRRMRISKKRPIESFLRKYGITSAEDYDWEHIVRVLSAIKVIIETCGLVELESVGKFLLALSNTDCAFLDKVLDELEGY